MPGFMSRLSARRRGWNAIWSWRVSCSSDCCRSLFRSCRIWSWRQSSRRPGRLAATYMTPAAIYAALVSGILRSHPPIEPGPAEMLRAVNFSLGERRIDGQFVSLIYAVWDDEQQTLQVANSGLPRPLYWHDDKMEIIEATGLPLGLFDDADYDEFTFNAKPGDKFVFFSDGILDARNEAGDLFGRSRVEQIVANSDGIYAEGLVNSLFDAVAEHASGVETFDDQTVVVIKVKDGSGSL